VKEQSRIPQARTGGDFQGGRMLLLVLCAQNMWKHGLVERFVRGRKRESHLMGRLL